MHCIRLNLNESIGHGSVDIPEVGVVEDVVDLPPQLNLALLAKLNVLEECQIVVEDRRHAHVVSRRIADLAQSRGRAKTTEC